MKKLSVSLVAFATLTMTACGGGGSYGPTVLSGVFKDSNVQGLSYVSGSQKGLTDTKGTFRYEEGSQVAFSIGGVNLGSALGKSIITPVDLVANGNLASDEVINRVRFLMMLDKDNIPSNGITISTAVQNKAKEWGAVNFAAEDFISEVFSKVNQASAVDGIEHPAITKEDAVAHLKTTLLCSYAGGFTGSYDGDEKGNVAFAVDPSTGEVTGSSYNRTNQVSVAVDNSVLAIDYDNKFEFSSAEDSGKQFDGKFTSTEAIDGNWKNTLTPDVNGAFSATRMGGSSSALYRYAGSYEGDGDRGLLTFDQDASKGIKGIMYSVVSGTSLDLKGSVENGEFKNVVLSDGTKITGFLGDGTLNGSYKKTNGDAGSFEGSGCKLN